MPLCRILYAEDNKYFHRLLMGELKPVEGVEIVWVSTVKDLMASLRQMSDPSDQCRFDCLILDLNFTGESQGVSTFEKVVADYSVPTIILTSDSSQDTYKRCMDLGAKEVFSKDVEPEIVAAKVVEIVANHKPSFGEKVKIGLLRAQMATKSAQTFAMGYTTAAVNTLVIAAIAYDFFFQYKTTGTFHPAEWETTIISVICGANGAGKIFAALNPPKKDGK